MKVKNVFTKVMSFLLAFIMVVSAMATCVFAAGGGSGAHADDYYYLEYDAANKEFVLMINADKFDASSTADLKDLVKDIKSQVFDQLIGEIRNRNFDSLAPVFDALSYDNLSDFVDISLFESYWDYALLQNVFTDQQIVDLIDVDGVKSMISLDDIKSQLTDEVIDDLFNDSLKDRVFNDPAVIKALFTESVMDSLFTPDEIHDIFSAEEANIKAAITLDDIRLSFTDSVINTVFTNTVINEIFTSDRMDTLVTDENLENLLSAPELAIVQADSTVTIEEILTYASISEVVNEITVDKIVDEISFATLLSYFEFDDLYELVPFDIIMDTVSLDALGDEVLLRKTIPEIVNAVTFDAIVDEIPLDELITYFDLDALYPLVPAEVIMRNVSLVDAVEKMSLSKIKQYIVPKLIEFVLAEVVYVNVNGTNVYSDAYFHLDTAIKMLIDTLPSMDDLLASSGETVAEFDVEYLVGENVKSFALRFGFYGDYSNITTILAKAAERADFNFDDSSIYFMLDLKESFGAMYSAFLASTSVNDASKKKIIDLFSVDGSEIADSIKALTNAEIIEFLSYAPADSAEEKLYNFIDTHPNYLDSLRARLLDDADKFDLIDKAAERLIGGVVAEYVTGNGRFHFEDIYTADLYEIAASKISAVEKFETMIDEKEVSIPVSIDVVGENLYQLRMVEDGAVIYTTILPENADLSLLTGGDEWTFEDGTDADVMPAANTVIFAPEVEYSIVFLDEENRVISIQKYTSGAEITDITEPPVPEKAGYIGRWSEYDVDDKDYTVTPVYSANAYRTLFIVDETTYLDTYYFADVDEDVKDLCEVPDKTGYTGDWQVELSGDIYVLTAIYTPVDYTATFMNGEDTVGTKTFTVEDTVIDAPAVPDKTGYTGAWEAYTIIADDITINAVYTPIQYTAIFVDEDTILNTVPYTILDGDPTLLYNVPEKTGYTGVWSVVSTEGNVTYIRAVYTSTDTGIYTATFKADGVIVAQIPFTLDDPVFDLPEVPVRIGCTGVWETFFLGESDITINAVYTPIAYKAIFITDEGMYKTIVYYITDPSAEELTPVPEKDGFDGEWEIVSVKKEVTVLAAKYTPKTYKATFKADGDIVDEIDFTLADASINAPEVPEKTGYTGAWEAYTLSAGNIEINAVYTPITYTFIFVAGDQVIEVSFDAETIGDVQFPEVPEKFGYEGKWSVEEFTLENKIVVPVYNFIDVEFDIVINGDVVEHIVINTEGIVDLDIKLSEYAEENEKPGYFVDWEYEYNDDEETSSINLVYIPVEYFATFTVDGRVISTEVFTVEDTDIDIPEVPAKAGYTANWADFELGTEDITVEAEYTAIEYKATFMADDEVVAEITFTVENMYTVEFPEVPEKEGYFGTWDKNVLDAADTVVTAEYIEIGSTDDGNAQIGWALLIMAAVAAVVVVLVIAVNLGKKRKFDMLK